MKIRTLTKEDLTDVEKKNILDLSRRMLKQKTESIVVKRTIFRKNPVVETMIEKGEKSIAVETR
jgi:hypothetical protein